MNPFVQMQRGAFRHAVAPRPPVGQTPCEVIHRQGRIEVKHYAAAGGRPPVVLVPSLINRAWILDLEPDRSLVGALAAAGHPTYLVDWGVPGPEDADEDVGRVLELLHRSIDRVCRHARHDQAFILGYCQGGTLAVLYAALHPQRVRGLVALNAPVSFAHGGRFRDFVDPARFDARRIVGADGLVPVELMKPAFQLLDPVGSVTKYAAVEAAAEDPARLRRVMARERWLEENVPVSGVFAGEFIRYGYQEDRLLAGTWPVRGAFADPRRIEAPVLVVTCERDFICPPAAALPLLDAVGSTDKEAVRLECGHIGVVVGAEGPRTFYPLLDRWLRRVAP